tara:strand:- start:20446 stop:21102 length:657 start_codon:yes stop_codon:yes gene_type:complete
LTNERKSDLTNHLEKVIRNNGRCEKRKYNFDTHGTASCFWCDNALAHGHADNLLLQIRKDAVEESIHITRAIEMAKQQKLEVGVIKVLQETFKQCSDIVKNSREKSAQEVFGGKKFDATLSRHSMTEGYRKTPRPKRPIEEITTIRGVLELALRENWPDEAMAYIPGTDANRRDRVYRRRKLLKQKQLEEENPPEEVTIPKKVNAKNTFRRLSGRPRN